MSNLLELAHFSHGDSVTKMQIGFCADRNRYKYVVAVFLSLPRSSVRAVRLPWQLEVIITIFSSLHQILDLFINVHQSSRSI